MVTARDIMTRGAACAAATETLVDVARRMRMLDIGAMPVCGEDGRLQGMITDRDIVVKCVAAGESPADHRAGDLAQGHAITVDADDSVEEALRTMMNADVRRLPVLDRHSLVGMVTLADLAMSLPDDDVSELVGSVSSAAPNN
ncbi:CBS domain-containing protein [Nocardioides sp. AN3]